MLPLPGFSNSKTDAGQTGAQYVIGGGTVPVYVWFILAAVAIAGLVLWFRKK